MDKIKLSQEIEILREQLYKLATEKPFTNENVIEISQKLDILLVKYQLFTKLDKT